MAQVEVEILALTGKLFRKSQTITNECANLRDLLAVVSREHEEVKSVLGQEKQPTGGDMAVLVNGKYPLNGLSTKLNDKDKVTILPIIPGG